MRLGSGYTECSIRERRSIALVAALAQNAYGGMKSASSSCRFYCSLHQMENVLLQELIGTEASYL